MSARAFLSALVSAVFFGLGAAGPAQTHPGPREAEWNKVAEAAEDDLPEAQIKLLAGIQEASYAAGAWPEGAKAQLLRIMLQAEHEDDTGHTIRALEAEIPGSPESARPLLRLLRAETLAGYGFENFDELLERSATGGKQDEDFETWDLTTWAAATDRAFHEALADAEVLKKIPVGGLAPLLRAGEVGDAIRPTLYDFIAHSALNYFAAEAAHLLDSAEYEDATPPDPFVIRTDSPALDPAAAFLAWQLPEASSASPRLRALRLYQELLAFHRNDADRAAFLHCDLERLRFAGYAAVGAGKNERRNAAFRAFIKEHDEHPVSADARAALARRLLEREERKEAHAVALAGATAFPDHPYGKECREIVAEIEAKQLGLETETHWTPAGAELTVNHTNLNHIWLRAYPAKWSPKEALESDPTPDGERERAALLRRKPALAWDAPLPDDGDFKPRVTELPAPKDLEPGFYLIVASGSADFSAKVTPVLIQPVHITRLALVVRRDGDQVGGLVTDSLSGAPLPGVEVVRWQKRKLLPGIASTKTRTDADGWFTFPKRKDDEEVMLTAGKGADLAVARADFYRGQDDDDDGKRVVLFTDRRIYRPGQTIHFKGVWCEANWREGVYRTLEGRKATARLLDPKGNEVAKQECVSNEWGSFSGKFTAPAGGLLGSYNLTVSERGTIAFRIEEYKRPKFAVTIAPPQGQAALGDKVSAVLRATAFTGAAVDGAKVTWRITRTIEWPEWAHAAGECRRTDGKPAEIARGTAVTGPDGTLPLVFTAEPDEDADPAGKPVFRYEIEATVTDAAGESHDADLTVVIGHTGFGAQVFAAGWQTTDLPVNFTVATRRHGDGPPCAAAGTLTIHRLKEPATCPRGSRQDRYIWRSRDDDPTDIRRWPLGEQIASMPAQTNKDGEAIVAATVPAGVYRAVFTAQDANGREVKATHDFQVLDLSSGRFPTHRPFVMAAPGRKLKPGEPFTVVWGSGHEEARACVEFFKDGKLLKREWSAPGRTQQVFTIATDESMRGGITARVTQTTLNRLFEERISADIPWSNKKLKVRWEHFTDKLAPGARETWTAVVTAPDGSPAPVEMVAALYDASLDELQNYFWNPRYAMISLLRYDGGLSPGAFASIANGFDPLLNPEGREDDFSLERPYRDWFEEREDYGDYAGGISPLFIRTVGQSDDWALNASTGMSAKAMSSVGGLFGSGGTVALSGVMTMGLRSGDGAISRGSIDAILNGRGNYIETNDAPPAPVPQPPRKNLQETAFFLPHLVSDEKGEVRISFTMPEALTTWRFFGFAHDKELRSGILEGTTFTAKDLMVQPNPPRFLREGDTLAFTVRITNQSDREQSGTARLTLTDAATLKEVTAALGVSAAEQPWTVPAKQSRALSWRLTVPDDTGFLNYRATATAGDLTDGEEGWLPVLPRRVVLTESVNLPVRDAGSREFVLDKLAASGGSPTLEHRSLTIETVANPAWYALLSLPYLMEFPHECAEQVFHRYYANALARHLVTSRPELRNLLEQWRQTKALDSPLAKNPDLAGLALEETPWLAAAADQAQSRRRIAELFDANRLEPALAAALEKVRAMQLADGLWPWFPGGPGNAHITCTIATGFARLRAAGVPTDITPALKALEALDAEIDNRYREIIRRSLETKVDPATVNWLDPFIAEYLHTRTLFLKDREVDPKHRGAFRFFVENANRHWAKLDSRMSRAHIALALHRCLDETTTPRAITRSLREHAKVSPDTGMEWKDAESGWFWWQSPLETQAMMIEVFREIERDDRAVDDCRTWLIARKQTTDWGTTTATADAVHALLTGGRDWLQPAAPLEIALGGVPQTPSAPEPGTGAQELRVAGPAIQPDMARITLTKSGPGVAWAAAHWQYAEDLSRVTAHDTPGLKLETGWLVRQPDRSLALLNGPLKPGDELVTRLVIRADRPLEFVHLKVPRASGTEPMSTLSGYRWQGRIGYYETTRDAASHYFIDALPAGTHVFETGMRIQHAGIYQTGAAEVRCMYAPAFAAHGASRGITAE
jgi:hypothetical protein